MHKVKISITNRHAHRIKASTRKNLTFLATLLLLVFSAPQLQAQTAPTVAAARGETVQFQSKLVGKTLPYNVLLPPDYASPAAQTTRYPVLYLLHGLFGHYTDWLAKTKLNGYAASHHLIIVMPEGNNSWYTDSATNPSDKYEAYLTRELIPDVQKRFRTIESREGRAIAGLSMGGYGALKLGMKYPEQFSFAASMSGALPAASWTEADLRKGGEFALPSITAVFGPTDNPTHAANDLFKFVREFPNASLSSLPYFYLDCGTEDSLLRYSRSLADIFLERKIPHEYRELPGKHNWILWDAQIRDVLRIAEERMSLPQKQTTRFESASPAGISLQARRKRLGLTAHTGD